MVTDNGWTNMETEGFYTLIRNDQAEATTWRECAARCLAEARPNPEKGSTKEEEARWTLEAALKDYFQEVVETFEESLPHDRSTVWLFIGCFVTWGLNRVNWEEIAGNLINALEEK